MVRRAEHMKGVNLDEAMQHLLDLDPTLWSRLMDLRRETNQHIIVLVNGSTVDVLPAQTQPLPMESIKRLESGQGVAEVSSLDDAPRARLLKMAGDAHWQVLENVKMEKPARVIPIDEKMVLVMDDPADPYTMNQEDPRGIGFDGVDEAA